MQGARYAVFRWTGRGIGFAGGLGDEVVSGDGFWWTRDHSEEGEHEPAPMVKDLLVIADCCYEVSTH